MKQSQYKSYDELPLFLNAEMVANALGVSPSSGYELMHEKDFPALKVGKWNGNLRYTILPIQGAVEHHDEQHLARLDAALERKRVRMKRAEQHRDQRRKSQAKYLEATCAARDPEELPL